MSQSEMNAMNKYYFGGTQFILVYIFPAVDTLESTTNKANMICIHKNNYIHILTSDEKALRYLSGNSDFGFSFFVKLCLKAIALLGIFCPL